MKTALLLLALATVALPARAEWQPPNAGDVALLAASGVLTAVDFEQTLDIKNHNAEWCKEQVFDRPGASCAVQHEGNPILGQHPTDARIRGYFAVSALLHVALWLALPNSTWRRGLSALTITFEGFTDLHNASVGLQVKF